MKLVSFWYLLVFVLGASDVWSAPTDRKFTVEYMEPTENADVSVGPLDDLAETRIYTDVIGDGVSGTTFSIPATAKTGGGQISKDLCIPILDDVTATHITISVSAVDETGNESERSPELTWPVAGTSDCSIPPPPVDITPPLMPQDVQIQ